MSASRAVDLTTGSIKKILLKLTLPMIFGMLGMVIFNLIDTYFIGQLGKIQLAAISFTFPVVLVVQSISLGVGMGTGSVISRIAGKGDTTGLKRLATDSLILAILVVIVSMIIGVFTIEPLFSALGADGTVMPYIKGYMSIWYFGLPFVVVPMVGNNIIRSLGDTMVPGLVMIGSSVLNAVLDPLLIFGISIFPKNGDTGGGAGNGHCPGGHVCCGAAHPDQTGKDTDLKKSRIPKGACFLEKKYYMSAFPRRGQGCFCPWGRVSSLPFWLNRGTPR